MTHIKENKLFNALMILMLMLGTLGITGVAAKCDPATNPNCPTDAPGQEPVTPPTSGPITVVTGSLVNNGGQVVQGGGNGVVNQALAGSNNSTVTIVVAPETILNLPEGTNATVIVAGTDTVSEAAPTSPGVVSNSAQGNQPTGADCSSLAGVVLAPPAETVTAQQLHDILNWSWKDGPTGGRNRIRATNVCISNGGNGSWTNNLPEPANSVNDIASWKKLQRWADLYNAGQLVVFTP